MVRHKKTQTIILTIIMGIASIGGGFVVAEHTYDNGDADVAQHLKTDVVSSDSEHDLHAKEVRDNAINAVIKTEYLDDAKLDMRRFMNVTALIWAMILSVYIALRIMTRR